MIKEFDQAKLDAVMKIWLYANIMVNKVNRHNLTEGGSYGC